MNPSINQSLDALNSDTCTFGEWEGRRKESEEEEGLRGKHSHNHPTSCNDLS